MLITPLPGQITTTQDDLPTLTAQAASFGVVPTSSTITAVAIQVQQASASKTKFLPKQLGGNK